MSRTPPPAGSGFVGDLARPPWFAAAIFCALASGLLCYPSWPGMMSYDSLFAYDQALYGVQTSLWPPLHSYLFMASRAAHADTWGVFLLQTFALLYGAALTLTALVRPRALAWTLVAFFVGGLAFFPTLLGAMQAHWRDVTTGAFGLLGVGLWLGGARARSILLVMAAILAMGISVALRYNAFVLVAPALLLMMWRPFLERAAGPVARILTIATVIATLGLAWASTQWRLPDLQRMPGAGNFASIQLFDVIGVSACSGHDYLPTVLTGSQVLSADQLRTIYDPRHLLITLQPHPGIPVVAQGDGGGRLQAAWRDMMVREPGCYLAHRAVVFAEQMGMEKAEVFYPIHAGIDANRYGLKLSHPQAAAQLVTYVEGHADEAWRRPWLLYVSAVVLALAAAARARGHALLLLALLAGVLAYPALLFVVAPAADARYIFPSNALALLLSLASLGLLAGGGGSRAR